MSLRWLASLMGAKAGAGEKIGKVGIRRKAAPQAQRDLANEIGAHALQIRRTWVRGVNHEGRQRRTVIVRVDPRGRRDIEAWLTGPEAGGDARVFSVAMPQPETGDAEAHAPAGNDDDVVEAQTADTSAASGPDCDAPDANGEVSTADGPSAEADAIGTLSTKTSWLLLKHADEAVLVGAVVNDADPRAVRRFNLRFDADADRACLEALARTGRLALIAAPLRWGPHQELASPHVYVPVDPEPLRDFLRERPIAVV